MTAQDFLCKAGRLGGPDAKKGVSMRNPFTRPLTAVFLVLIVSSIAFAQRGRPDPRRGVQSSGPSVPHDPHDLTGVWRGNAQSLSKEPPPMTVWGKEQFDAHKPSYGPRGVPPALGNDPTGKRSEERRVGKERRSRESTDH